MPYPLTEGTARKRLRAALQAAHDQLPASILMPETDLNMVTIRGFVDGTVNTKAPTLGKLWKWAVKYSTDERLKVYAAAQLAPTPARAPLMGSDT